MLGQAGRSLEKQIARSDPPGDHRPAGTRQRTKRTDARRAGGRGRRPRPFSIAASGRAAGSPSTPFPLASRSCRWPGSMAARSSGASQGGPNPVRCRGLSAATLRTTPPRAYATSLPEADPAASPKPRRSSPSTSQIPRIRLHQVAAEDGLLIFSHYLPEIRRMA